MNPWELFSATSTAAPNANWEIDNAGQVRIWWNSGELDLRGTTDLRDNQWHHVAFVRDTAANEFRAHIDGAPEPLTPHNSAGSDLTFTTPPRIGNDYRPGAGVPFHGTLDELAVYDRVLSSATIQRHAAAGIPVMDQRGMSFGRFHDGDGDLRVVPDIGAFEVPSVLFVDNIVDENDGDYSAGDFSLREALERANATPEMDVIRFDADIAGQTIDLTEGQLTVRTSLRLMGPGADLLTINAGGASRIFDINDGSSDALDVELSGLTLAGGAAFKGGAVLAYENLTIREAVVMGNSATSGGAIATFSQDTVIVNSTLSGNTSNSVGALFTRGAVTSIRNSTLSDNSSASDGGAIWAGWGGSMTLENSTLSGNSANGNGGAARLALISQIDIGHATVTNNTADADSDGVGSGGGLSVMSGGTFQMSHTIVAGNMDHSGIAPDIGSADGMALTFSLIGNRTGSLFLDLHGNIVGTGLAPVDARLRPLMDNGGPTLTHVPRQNSPARNAGDPALAGSPEFDQRGRDLRGSKAIALISAPWKRARPPKRDHWMTTCQHQPAARRLPLDKALTDQSWGTTRAFL